jgi:hypothetical protein
MRDKARFVIERMEERMAALGKSWADTTATQVYAVHDIHSFLADEIVQRGAAQHGLIWHYTRPPVEKRPGVRDGLPFGAGGTPGAAVAVWVPGWTSRMAGTGPYASS